MNFIQFHDWLRSQPRHPKSSKTCYCTFLFLKMHHLLFLWTRSCSLDPTKRSHRDEFQQIYWFWIPVSDGQMLKTQTRFPSHNSNGIMSTTVAQINSLGPVNQKDLHKKRISTCFFFYVEYMFPLIHFIGLVGRKAEIQQF